MQERAEIISHEESAWQQQIRNEELNQTTYAPPQQQQGKKRGRPNKQADPTFNWSDEATASLIELWHNHEVLFNSRHPAYHIRDEKSKALEIVKESLAELDVVVSVKDITNKFQSLRTYFCKERGKLVASKSSGAGADQVYTTKWRFYDSLLFLDDNMTPRGTVSSLNHSWQEHSSSPYNAVNTPSAKSQKLSSNRQIERTEKLMETAVEFLKTPTPTPPCNARDDDDAFADLVGRMMRKIPDGERKDMLRIDIQTMIIQVTHVRNTATNILRSPLHVSDTQPSPASSRSSPYDISLMSMSQFH